MQLRAEVGRLGALWHGWHIAYVSFCVLVVHIDTLLNTRLHLKDRANALQLQKKCLACQYMVRPQTVIAIAFIKVQEEVL